MMASGLIAETWITFSRKAVIFQRHPLCKLFSEPFRSMLSTEQWSRLGSVTGKCLQFLFTVFRHFPSLGHSSAASCRKSRGERGISGSFSKSILGRLQFGRKPAQVSEGEAVRRGLRMEAEQGPSSGWVSFYGHVLTVQNSREECLLKSWRLNHK